MNSKKSDVKSKQEFAGSAAKGKSIPSGESVKAEKEFGKGKKK